MLTRNLLNPTLAVVRQRPYRCDLGGGELLVTRAQHRQLQRSQANCPFRYKKLANLVRGMLLMTLLIQVSPKTGICQRQSTEGEANITVQIPYRSKVYIGKPLAWDGRELALLRRDGRLTVLPVASTDDFQTVSESFRPYSVAVMRRQLQQEFGSAYQVSVTANFIVVHPVGSYQKWAMPFEDLYTRFKQYFSSRRFQLKQPEFPLIAVVLNTRAEFDRFLQAYHEADDRVLGYYSPKSNRVITYQQADQGDADWILETETIIHEAAHQTAFNLGLHSRFAPVPRWISEGLAMLFEAPGINNSVYYTDRSDRINRGRLGDLQSYYQQGVADGRLAELISDDQLFRTDPLLAYALAWGLTFYLSEKLPQEYFAFLAADAMRKDFFEYPSQQRATAFAEAFGPKLNQLEFRMKQFILELE